MNEFQLLNDKKELANSQDILRDVLSGDPNALLLLDDKNLDKNAIKLALDFIMNNNTISDKEKKELLTSSWRINYRAPVPTPEEFLTDKYIGASAHHTYDRIKKVFVEFMDPEKPYRNLILYPHIGYGKALPKNTKVQTPSGPVEMRDLKIGDLVCNTYGGTSKVLAKADFPDEDVYKFIFADGRETLACGNHYWKAFFSTYQNKIWDEESQSYKTSDVIPCWKIITTNEIIEDLKKNPKHTWKIPLPKPVYYEEKKHMISPYSVGAFLGDGCFSNVCNIVGDDLEIHERILKENKGLCTFHDLTGKKNQGKRTVKYSTNLNADFRRELMRLGLKDKKCDSKFIPGEYLYDSIENRIALLQGLMDTDGTVENNGPKARERNDVPMPSFRTSSEQLAKDFATLVRGLGGICRIHKYGRGSSSTCNYNAYTVNFNFPNNSFPIFHLKRKQEPFNIYFNRERKYKQKNKPKYISIKSIEKIDQKGGQCIEIDSDDHCFLAEDYIVTHNSYLATLINIYICTCVSLMRNPWKFFGLNPASVIVQFLCSYSLKKSSELLLEPYMNILESSKFFEKVHSREKMKKAIEDYDHMEQVDRIFYTTASPTSELTFTGGMNIKTISNPQGLLGASCVSCTFSELAFFTLAGKTSDYIMELYNKGKSRVETRMKGNYYGRTILDSSPNNIDNAIDNYIINDADRDPTNYIVKGSMWHWEPDEYDFSKTFKVYTGGKGNPPRIIEEGDPLLKSNTVEYTKIIEIPERFSDGRSVKQYFIDDIVEALKDRAGIPSGSADNLIYDYDKLEKIFKPGLRNIYTNIYASSLESPIHLIWDQIKDIFFKYRAGKYEYYYKPWAPRYIGVDQSYSTDVTCISMVHAERYRDSGELIYVVDFTIPIVPLKDGGVNLEAIRCFIEDLKNLGGVRIEGIGFDSFQSEITKQNLSRSGFNVKDVSTDKTMEPYLDIVNLINTGRIACGRNIFFKNNLKSLHTTKTKNGKGSKPKIDHDNSREGITYSDDTSWEHSPLGSYAKDVSDAVADAIYLCKKETIISSDTWWDEPKVGDFEDGSKDKKTAKENLNKLMNKFGLH